MEDQNKMMTPRYTSVGGWLLLFCIVLTILSPLRTVITLLYSYSETTRYFDYFPGLKVLFYIDAILSSALMVLCIRAGIALWTIKQGAVKQAKTFLILFLCYAGISVILPFMAGLPDEANSAMVPEVIKSLAQALIFFGIWYSYLNVSKRVKATYPEFIETPEEAIIPDTVRDDENNYKGER